MNEIKNALITSTYLGIEDHGIMTFYLSLDYGGMHQSAGGWVLDAPFHNEQGKFVRRVGTALGLDLIMQVLKVVGVGKWEELPGKFIRVEADFGKVHAIGHPLKDEWVRFEEFFGEGSKRAQDHGQ